MMNRFLFILTLLTVNNTIKAQTTEDSVKAVINEMFRAMKNADTTGLKNTVSANVVFQTIDSKATGEVGVNDEKITDFVNAIGKLKAGDADEQVVFDMVKIDGPL